MDKVIYLPDSVKKEMAATFKVSSVTVWNALTYKTNSDFARMLRAAAVERGGVIYPGKKAPKGHVANCSTTFDSSDHTMTQIFGDKASIVANLKTGNVVVYVDGEVHYKHSDVTLRQLSDIQYHVEEIVSLLK